MRYSAHEVLAERIARAAKAALEGEGVVAEVQVERAPPERGDLTINVYRIARSDVGARDLAEKLAGNLSSGVEYVKAAKAEGGYVNIEIDPSSYGQFVWRVVSSLGSRYGYKPHPSPSRIIVEHTSANPVHPLHIGHLRNCIVGDALARLLRARGHDVEVHFYIDDVGLQVAYAAYGYEKVRHVKRAMKPDHFIGLIYAITNAIINVRELQARREKVGEEERARIDGELSDWLWVAKELMEKDEELFTLIAEAVKREDALKRINDINRAYEAGEEWAVKLVRETVELCLEGFRQTLQRLGISYDSWDWESEVTTWNGLVRDVIAKLRATGFVVEKGGALVFQADRLAEDAEVRRRLGLSPSFAISSMTLVRSDGTTLYATRDIAYTIWKYKRGVDKVINVVGAEQSLEQAHVRLALYSMGYVREAENALHFAYEMVNLPGVKMSGRRGRYITADELIDEAVRRAREELVKRGVEVDEEVAERVGIGAVKFAILSVAPSRPLTFTWERVLDFERNSGPFVQYAYVRARSVLRKAGDLKPAVNGAPFGEEERKLLFLIGYFPEVVAKAADELKIELVPQYLNELASAFNKYYDEVPILKAEPREKAEARLALTYMVAITLENGMRILGIEPPHRM
ncbi:MAG: arginine--tRNA ligase [Thermofilaceae archaeon]